MIKLNNFEISNNSPLVFALGPCQIESHSHAIETADQIKTICDKLKVNFIYKSSFDKANRTSVNSKRGIGIKESLKIFSDIKAKFNCPVLTDIHNESQCEIVKDVVDIIQIPAFLCRQTDLLIAAGKTNKIIKIKKGQFLAPWDMKSVIEKVISTGNKKIILTERGSCFGYNNLVNDMKSLPIMKNLDYPVFFDATHSVMMPGANGTSSGGNREFIEPLARAAASIGIAGIFMECHEEPDNAPSDGKSMLRLDNLENLLIKLKSIDKLIKSFT